MDVIVSLIVLAFSIILHEVAHGYVAYRLGDPTAKNARRLTLNPMAHIDPLGTVVLPLLLVITRSPVLFGWAKPVPYNPAYFRDPKKGTMLVGAAGPLTNLALAVIAALFFRLLAPSGLLADFLLKACVINVILALFNLIPIPPLDGSRVMVGLLPPDLVPPYLRLERFGMFIIFGLLWLGALDHLVFPLAGWILQFLLQ